jgi:hypothetical protein
VTYAGTAMSESDSKKGDRAQWFELTNLKVRGCRKAARKKVSMLRRLVRYPSFLSIEVEDERN